MSNVTGRVRFTEMYYLKVRKNYYTFIIINFYYIFRTWHRAISAIIYYSLQYKWTKLIKRVYGKTYQFLSVCDMKELIKTDFNLMFFVKSNGVVIFLQIHWENNQSCVFLPGDPVCLCIVLFYSRKPFQNYIPNTW